MIKGAKKFAGKNKAALIATGVPGGIATVGGTGYAMGRADINRKTEPCNFQCNRKYLLCS